MFLIIQRWLVRLPKWFGERPGKKKGETDTPDGEEGELVKPDDLDDLMAPQPEEEEEEEEAAEEEVRHRPLV